MSEYDYQFNQFQAELQALQNEEWSDRRDAAIDAAQRLHYQQQELRAIAAAETQALEAEQRLLETNPQAAELIRQVNQRLHRAHMQGFSQGMGKRGDTGNFNPLGWLEGSND